MTDDGYSRHLLQQLTLGVVETIDSKPGVFNVKHDALTPADRHTVLSWEQKNITNLPDDLKQFYLTSDGLRITWSVKLDSGPFQLGKMWINPISQLSRIGGVAVGPAGIAPSLADLHPVSETEEEDDVCTPGGIKPRFDSTCKLYELDPCDGYGKVCLVYKGCKIGTLDSKPDIWFLDRALNWHYMCDSFTAYYRLMVMHFGLPQWQYAFTDIGLSSQAKQWFHLFAPLRLELDLETHIPADTARPPSTLTQIDVSKVFKGRAEKKKPSNSAPPSQGLKKKAAVPGNKSLDKRNTDNNAFFQRCNPSSSGGLLDPNRKPEVWPFVNTNFCEITEVKACPNGVWIRKQRRKIQHPDCVYCVLGEAPELKIRQKLTDLGL
ncbi:tubulin polyglutamylase complex subunit 2-like [Liolophura sinensis]|uniref:tubulin polyglutamylase complex subunit 2-like n=1 Tax=Liolophura sinensis TaxID=3198878 RepID=UPI003159372A